MSIRKPDTDKINEVLEWLCIVSREPMVDLPDDRVSEIFQDVYELAEKHSTKEAVEIIKQRYEGEERAIALFRLLIAPLNKEIEVLRKKVDKEERWLFV